MSDFEKAKTRVEKLLEGSEGAFTDDLRTILAGIDLAKEEIEAFDKLHNECASENDRLRDLLAQGLDLCARAKRMSEREEDAPRLLVWFEMQYQTDLAKWEDAASGLLKGVRDAGRTD